jgi:hypothetical protein
MRSLQWYVQQVRQFHVHQRLGIDQPWSPNLEILRRHLIHEELAELELAWYRSDIAELMDAVGDLMYVIAGTATQFGFTIDDEVYAVQRDICDMQVVDLSVYLHGQMDVRRMDVVRVRNMLARVIQFAMQMDLPYGEIFDRVQAANMTKTPRLDGDERVSNKGTTFVPPVYDDLVAVWRGSWKS